MDAARRGSEEKIEQVDKVNAVRKRDARVRPRPFEPAELRPQHFELAESSLRDRLPQPDRGWVEPENVSHLQNQPGILCGVC